MNSLEQWLEGFGLLVAIAAYLAAIVDWYRADPYELNDGRRPSLLWAGVSGLIVLVMIGLVVAWSGLESAATFLRAMSGGWLLKALVLIFLVQAGGYWAQSLARQPFRLESVRWRRWPWLWLAASLAFMLAWTAILMTGFPHRQPTASLFEAIGLGSMPPFLKWPFVIGILTLAPIFEECLYRHYLLYRLAALFPGRYRHVGAAVAICIASLAWATAHHGLLEPYWLKITQTFVLGLVLGLTAWRHGLAATIALHWLFNMALIPVTLWLARH